MVPRGDEEAEPSQATDLTAMSFMDTKKEAVDYAVHLRENGHLARVEKVNKVPVGWPSDTGWVTYARKK